MRPFGNETGRAKVSPPRSNRWRFFYVEYIKRRHSKLYQAALEAARTQAAHRHGQKEAALLKLLIGDISDRQASTSTSSASALSRMPLSVQPRPQEQEPLTPREEAIVAAVMAQHPTLTYEEAVRHLRLAGM
jgi:hypothetical protein